MRAKIALAGGCLLAALPAAGNAQEVATPCSFELQVSDEFLPLLQSWGGLGVDDTAALCEQIAAEGAGLNIVDDSGFAYFGTYAVVMVGLVDKASGLSSADFRVGLTTMPGSEEIDRQTALRQALQSAMTALLANPDPLIASLRNEITDTRRSLVPEG